MPKDHSGKEKPYHKVQLSGTSVEYQTVYLKFMVSASGSVSRVVSISRIQNPQLYKSFMARKETMDATRPNGSNEKQLFHGTSEGSCDGINHHGFNRSLAGVNGNVRNSFLSIVEILISLAVQNMI